MYQPDWEHKFSSTNIPKTIRFTEKIDEELLSLQKATGIPYNQLVLQCCRYALDHLSPDP